MPKFGTTSLNRLATCDVRLQTLMHEVIKYIDLVIICGHRNEAEQELAYRSRLSKLRWPDSKHNSLPSKAVDVAYWDSKKISWDEKQAAYVAGYIKATADRLGIKIRLGGDWNRNNNVVDEKFIDLPHIELED